MAGPRLECRVCPVADRPRALAIFFRRMPEILRPRMVADALSEAEHGAIDLSGLWIASKKARIVGVLLTHALAGRALAVWAPEVVPVWRRRSVAVALIRSALSDAGRRGYRVAQALVDRTSPRSARGDLSRGGMPRVTQLVFMARSTSVALATPPTIPEFLWTGYGPETDGEFRRVLAATYSGSLDMPELEGVRSLDDVIAGHRAAGRFDPSRWSLGHLPDDPRASAIILLTAQPERGSWEVAYLGLTPAARGRGLGRAALAHALEMSRPHVARLELAVDARNKPAAKLYRRAGFLPYDRKAVHLRVLSAGVPEC